MDRSKRVVLAFMNSAEGYFNKKRIIEDHSKQQNCLSNPPSKDHPEDKVEYHHNKWNYKDIRDIAKVDLDAILSYAVSILDQELYKILPEAALAAALQMSIQSLGDGKFQNKIDAPTYDVLLKILILKSKEKGI